MLFPIGSETEGSGVSLPEFKDKLDLEAGATVAGHSFGGATTVLSLAKVIFCYFFIRCTVTVHC
jgi:hypothetical protein